MPEYTAYFVLGEKHLTPLCHETSSGRGMALRLIEALGHPYNFVNPGT